MRVIEIIYSYLTHVRRTSVCVYRRIVIVADADENIRAAAAGCIFIRRARTDFVSRYNVNQNNNSSMDINTSATVKALNGLTCVNNTQTRTCVKSMRFARIQMMWIILNNVDIKIEDSSSA